CNLDRRARLDLVPDGARGAAEAGRYGWHVGQLELPVGRIAALLAVLLLVLGFRLLLFLLLLLLLARLGDRLPEAGAGPAGHLSLVSNVLELLLPFLRLLVTGRLLLLGPLSELAAILEHRIQLAGEPRWLLRVLAVGILSVEVERVLRRRAERHRDRI